MRTFAFVFARGGSKGVIKKNIKFFAKKPLIAHSIKLAKQLPEIEHCFVSTDSKEIGMVAKRFGATIIKRPKNMSRDDSPEFMAWRHAVSLVEKKIGKFDRFISIPTTSPLRTLSDIQKCLDALDEATDVVITMTPAQKNPWFNMVTFDQDGKLRLVNKKKNKIIRRQDAPEVFDMTGVCFVARKDFILKSNNIWDGRVRGIIIPPERAIDIDTEYDFKLAELLYRIKK